MIFKHCAQGASQGKTVALDLMEVDLADGQKRMSFFGVTIGLVADVDIGSEALRCLGWMRAYILVAMRILLPKYYRVKVSYLPLSLDAATGQPIPVSPKAQCLKITQNVAFEWHFPSILDLLKLTCLVTLFDRKLQVFKNSPKWTIFGI